MKRSVIAALLAVFLISTVGLNIWFDVHNEVVPANKPITQISEEEIQYNKRFILHAAGVTPQGAVGSNSLEAINHSYQNGYRIIEIDFCWTEDGHLVCVHDWDRYYGPKLGKNILTYEEFEQLRRSYGYTSMTLDDLTAWLADHKDTVIVTDIKDNNLAGSRLIAEKYPQLLNQFWIQIYGTDEYDPISQLGFENIILTVYQMTWHEKTDTAALVQFARSHPLSGLTFPIELMDLSPGYLEALQQADTPLYVHTINDAQTQQALFDMGVAGVYTDIGNAMKSQSA